MKKIKYIAGCVVLILLAGCKKDFLDTKPYNALSSSNIWTSDNNASLAVNSIYNALGDYYGLQNFNYFFSDLGPDGYTWADADPLAITKDVSSPNTPLYGSIYVGMYKVISRANDAITHLKGNTDISENLGNEMLGQAEFLRGLSYFYLWQLYGGVVILDKSTLPGDTYLPRNSADEVKELVIADFTDAVSRLPVSYDSDKDKGRATRGAAIAMLGKVYLYDKQWGAAAEQFEKLTSPPFSYELLDDYGNLFDYEFENNAEDVFSLQYMMESGFGNFSDVFYSGRSAHSFGFMTTSASYGTISSYINQDGTAIDMSAMPVRGDYDNEYDYGMDLIAWYQKAFADVDKRLQASVILPGATFLGNNNQLFMVKWPYSDHAKDDTAAYQTPYSNIALIPWRKFSIPDDENTNRFDAPTNIPIIRYADVLLMYAEAENEADGPSAEAYHAVNLVRERAGIPDLPPALSQEAFRRAVRVERLREFPGEGILYFDVKRWQLADTDDPVFGLNRYAKDFRGENLYQRVFTKRNYLWPIPQSAVDINGKLTQNPEW